MTIKYHAFDGREFETAEECLKYEDEHFEEMIKKGCLTFKNILEDKDIEYNREASENASMIFPDSENSTFYWVRALNDIGARKLSLLTGEEVYPSKDFFCIEEVHDEETGETQFTGTFDAGVIMQSFSAYMGYLGYKVSYIRKENKK